LPIRNTDAKFLLWTAAQLESDPAKHPRVIAICEQLTRLMPNHAVVQAKVAGLLVACGRTKEGVAAYEHALRLDPSLATAHSNLGVAYAEMGRVSEAIREFEAALRLEPGHPQARESLQLLKAGRP
jgi:tetratricopeptide (TPR) repeat protein